MTQTIEWWQWALALLGAFLVGLGKGGLPGVGSPTVVLFAMAFGAKPSVGLLLPVLIAADITAVSIYRHDADRRVVRMLLPWMAVGTVIGWLVFERIDARQVERLIGGIVLAMAGLQVWRSWAQRHREAVSTGSSATGHTLRAMLGLLGGFATMVANAAGPVAQIYFLSLNLPKLALIGTGAWAFFIINLFKVPFMMDLGILNFDSLAVSLWIAPAAVAGTLAGPRLVGYINEAWFTRLVLLFVVVSGVKLLAG